MSLRLLLASFIAVIAGFALGSIPVLNEHLHWNLWYVLPISGLLFGLGLGGIEFGYCFKMDQRIDTAAIIFLAAVTLLGYGAVDYGIYRSITVTVEQNEQIPAGDYELSELITFGQFMKYNLEGSSIDEFGQAKQIGSVGTKLSYFADLIGASLGAIGVLILCREKYPFCSRCSRYKKRRERYEILMEFDEQRTNEIFEKIRELINADVFEDVIAYFQQLACEFHDEKVDIKITVDQRYCPRCGEEILLGRVYRKSGRDWIEEDKLKFSYTSKPEEFFVKKHMGYHKDI